MPKKVDIAPDVRAVLLLGAWNGRVFKLPPGQLDSKLYQRVDKVLKALGGNWRRADGGHVFPTMDAPRMLAEALESGTAVDSKRTAEQFFTPPPVRKMVWERAELRRTDHVLEPSAGDGALLELPIRMGCLITAVEKDEALARGLIAIVPHHGGGIWMGDFMTWKPEALAPIDRVVMNPPFGRGQDMLHVTRALGFLRTGGRLVAVMSPHWTFAESAVADAFRQMVGRHIGDWHTLPAGSFKASGTDVNSGILTIVKGA